MFQAVRRRPGRITSALTLLELIHHSIVRSVRKAHNNAFIAIVINLLQVPVFVEFFFAMFSLLGLRGGAIRGDFYSA